MFFCEFCEIFKNTFFIEQLRWLLPELIKENSKVQENNMSSECALNFERWKTFSKNYKPMRVWLWLFLQI